MKENQFQKYMQSDDTGRLKIADKFFDEFKVKREPGHRGNTAKTVLGILGGLTGVAVAGLSIKHAIEHPYPHMRGHHGPRHNPNIPQFHWKGVPDLLDHGHGPGRGHGMPQPFEAAQRSIEMFERITEDVAVTAETVSNALHK